MRKQVTAVVAMLSALALIGSAAAWSSWGVNRVAWCIGVGVGEEVERRSSGLAGGSRLRVASSLPWQ